MYFFLEKVLICSWGNCYYRHFGASQKKEKKKTLWIGTTIFHSKSINIGGVKSRKLLLYPLNPQKQVPIGLLYLKIFATQLLAFFIFFFFSLSPFSFSHWLPLFLVNFSSLSSLPQSSVYIILLSYVKIKIGI